MFSRQLLRANLNIACRYLQVKSRYNINKAVLPRYASTVNSVAAGVKLKKSDNDDDQESVFLYSRSDVNVNDPVLLDAKTQLELSEIREKLQKQQIYKPEDFLYFNISPETVEKLKKFKIEKLFPVQYESFKHIVDGHDVVVQARTGTGKTLAFALPLLESLESVENLRKRGRIPVVLVLEPTRELAIQTANEFKKFKNKDVHVACFYGGTSYNVQERHLENGMDVLVGTPGRILDHLKSGRLDLSKVRHVVLDEADRMLGMGFQEELNAILSYSYTEDNKPQTLLFSATMPTWIKNMASKYMEGDVKIVDLIGKEVVKAATTVQHKAINCTYRDRPSTLNKVVKFYCGNNGRAIIFTQTKREASELVRTGVLTMGAEAIHGDRTQRERENTLNAFRSGKIKCLVATDVASRGLDIPEVDLVIQTEPPMDLDNYIHRAGRTGRAGNNGLSVICFDNRVQYRQLLDVQKRAGVKFKQIQVPSVSELAQRSMDDALQSYEKMNALASTQFLEKAKVVMASENCEALITELLGVVSGVTKLEKDSRLISVLENKENKVEVRSFDNDERTLDDVDPFFINALQAPAKELMEKENCNEQVASALAIVSQMIKAKQASLLTSRMGYTTLSINLKHQVNRIVHFWWMLKSSFHPDTVDMIKPLKMYGNRRGCVFDVPVSVADELLNTWPKDMDGTLSVASVIPPLETVSDIPYIQRDVFSNRSYNSGNGYNAGRRYNRYDSESYEKNKQYGSRYRNQRYNNNNRRDNKADNDDDDWEF